MVRFGGAAVAAAARSGSGSGVDDEDEEGEEDKDETTTTTTNEINWRSGKRSWGGGFDLSFLPCCYCF
jgi:hypothetical protein